MLIITTQIVGILAMLTFMLTGIWGLILLIKIYNQLKYKNYLMEKLTQNTSSLSLNHKNTKFPGNTVEIQGTRTSISKEILES